MAAMTTPRATPRMTHHARLRCEEMGISTKVAKHIYAHADLCYPGRSSRDGGTTIYIWSGDTRYIVVVSDAEPLVLTVSFNTPGIRYVRNGPGYAIAVDNCHSTEYH